MSDRQNPSENYHFKNVFIQDPNEKEEQKPIYGYFKHKVKSTFRARSI